MQPEDVGKWVFRKPFVPFQITMSNGRQIDVRSAAAILAGASVISFGDQDPDFPVPNWDKASFISYTHINTIEPLPAAAPPTAA